MMDDILRNLYLKKLLTGEIQGPLTNKPSIDKPWLKYYTDEAITAQIPMMTVYDYLFKSNEKNGDNVALSYFGRKITFGELFKNIDITANAFREMGVKEGDIVTISMPNTPEAVYMFYALSKLGAIANMVDPRTSSDGIEEYLNEVGSKLLVIIDVALDKVKTVKDTTNVNDIVVVSPADSLPLGLNVGYKVKEFVNRFTGKSNDSFKNDECILWRDFFEMGKCYSSYLSGMEYIGCSKYLDYEKDRPVVIVHTGGTTGQPKGVMLSNENINSVVLQSILTGINMKKEHDWLDIMPTFIAYGIGMGLHLPLVIGMETILIPQFDPKKFDELLLKHKPTHMIGVPSYWGTIINSKKLKKSDLSYMIAPTVGGDAMDTTLEVDANEFLKNHNCKYRITKGYGMTEVTGGVAGTVDENNEIGSVGIPFVKTTISIFDPETGEELGYNQDGEICITGPNTMLGYFKNQKATEDILKMHQDGKVWVHSGDIGYMTEDGNIYVVDRIKRMIIRYDGFKVFPSRVETVILEHPAVDTCRVVGMNDPSHSQGKLPCAFMVLKDKDLDSHSQEICDELFELCESKLPEYALPQVFRVKDELPYTPVGKIDVLSLESEINQEIKSNSNIRKRTPHKF